MKAIVVLGGGLIKDKKTNQWRTTNYDEPGDNFGIQGDRLRVLAGSYLYQIDPNFIIIASGSTGQLTGVPNVENLATVIKRELIELGVPAQKIIKEEKSNNTHQQLLILKQLIPNMKLDQVLIISNEWHLPRIKTMAELAPGLGKQFLNIADIQFVSAEKICLANNKQRWQPIIDKAYRSKELKQRINLEQKGIRDIKAGKYKFK